MLNKNELMSPEERFRLQQDQFLALIPKSNEVINISAGVIDLDEDEDDRQEDDEGEQSSGDDQGGDAQGSPSVTSTNNQTATNVNPLNYIGMLNSIESSIRGATELLPTSSFSLFDVTAQLLQIAVELDLTFSFHSRRSEPEFCFESNRTAERSGGRGRMLVMVDFGQAIRITEKANGEKVDAETWIKTDWPQMQWAIRGRCQKALHK